MRNSYTKTRVLITVMTYPQPSKKHEEVVCTAGITQSGEWVRLYPINYRFQPNTHQFKKYQWIDVELAPKGKRNDERKESRSPLLETITLIDKPLSSNNGWVERRKFIDRLPRYTVNQLRNLYEQDGTSLGIVKPKRIIDFLVEEVDRELKPEHQLIYDQVRLFGKTPEKLTKIPYKFSYKFQCEDNKDTVHSAMIEDWELGVLFLKERARHNSEEKAIESVINNFYRKPYHSSRDFDFFMGTVFPYNSWVVLGLYYPPIQYQPQLF